ncbi:MAG: hypothetical protein JNJ95_04430 [Dechloromonas sp.]|nr:hypothetical protein [Dechloromonas sp.]
MLLQDRLPSSSTAAPLRTGILREFAIRLERPARDQRVDLPEIQESFRVNFSDAVMTAPTEGARSVLQKARPSDEQGAAELKLRAYLSIAAL